MPKLVVMAKGQPREIDMGQELTIGRGYSNLLRLEGEEISRVHAIIFRRGEDFVVRDLDSKNGVFVNGNKINHAQLDSGDRLQVGKYRMVFNPPAGFDITNLSENGSSDGDKPSISSISSAGEDEELQSRSFKVAVKPDPSDVSFVATAPSSREEVTFFTRRDLERQSDEAPARIAEMAADYHDLFFDHLVHAAAADKSFSENLLAALVKATAADRGVIILRDAATGNLSPAAILSHSPDVAVNRIVLKSGFTEGKAVLCPQTRESGLFRDNDTVNRDRITSLLSIPMGDADPLGIIYLDRIGEAEPFTFAHVVVGTRIARLMEIYFRNHGSAGQTKGVV